MALLIELHIRLFFISSDSSRHKRFLSARMGQSNRAKSKRCIRGGFIELYQRRKKSRDMVKQCDVYSFLHLGMDGKSKEKEGFDVLFDMF